MLCSIYHLKTKTHLQKSVILLDYQFVDAVLILGFIFIVFIALDAVHTVFKTNDKTCDKHQ